MNADRLILDEYFKVEALFAPFPSLTDQIKLTTERLSSLRDELLLEQDFEMAKGKALSGLSDLLSNYLAIALTLGAESYSHTLSLREKDVKRAFDIPIDLLNKFAAEAEEKHFASSFGAMLNLSLLYGIEFQDIRKAYADCALKRYDAMKEAQDAVEPR
ncbi:MAG: hypothetical protein K6F32_04955 [Bacilli bacterium]|nr:hypothetical protein [Bacilli bacterium]